MKQFFTLLSALFLGATAMAQVAFQSDFSSWANGDPTDWAGTKTNLAGSNYSEVTTGATYGSSMINLINTGTGHKRFTTQTVTVTGGTTYNVNMWVSGLAGDLRTAYYDFDNASYSSYNNYSDVGALSAGSLVLITQSITVPANTTSIELILSLRNTDAAGIVIDSVSLAEPANPPMPVARSISELQNNGGNPSAFEDSLTITSGVVTALKSGDGYWIQDGVGAWSGIYIKDNVNTPTRGDSVTVTGKVAEVFGVTQIELLTGYVLEPTPLESIVPTMVSTVDINNLEDWEGVLVQVIEGECVTVDAGFGQWTLNNGAGAGDSVLVDDDLYSFTPTLGEDYNVTGIGHFSFSASKLLPRDADDIEVYVGPSSITESKLEFSIYPNPATNHIIINAVPNSNIKIYSISGNEVYSGAINQTLIVNTTDFSSGIYFVKLFSEGATSTQKLVIE